MARQKCPAFQTHAPDSRIGRGRFVRHNSLRANTAPAHLRVPAAPEQGKPPLRASVRNGGMIFCKTQYTGGMLQITPSPNTLLFGAGTAALTWLKGAFHWPKENATLPVTV